MITNEEKIFTKKVRLYTELECLCKLFEELMEASFEVAKLIALHVIAPNGFYYAKASTRREIARELADVDMSGRATFSVRNSIFRHHFYEKINWVVECHLPNVLARKLKSRSQC
jgi:hypothetical protein